MSPWSLTEPNLCVTSLLSLTRTHTASPALPAPTLRRAFHLGRLPICDFAPIVALIMRTAINMLLGLLALGAGFVWGLVTPGDDYDEAE